MPFLKKLLWTAVMLCAFLLFPKQPSRYTYTYEYDESGNHGYINSSDGIEGYHLEVLEASKLDIPPGIASATKNRLDRRQRYGTCIVGAGPTGAVFAERSANYLAENVLVIDSKPHIGGAYYDFVDPATRIRINRYGGQPPYAAPFRTNDTKLWNYVKKYGQATVGGDADDDGDVAQPKQKWYTLFQKKGESKNKPNGPAWDLDFVPLQGKAIVDVHGSAASVAVAPLTFETVNRLLNLQIPNEEEFEKWLQAVQIPCPPSPSGQCDNAEDFLRSKFGKDVSSLIYEPYLFKQWGKSPKHMPANAAVDLITSQTSSSYQYQAVASKGYTAWFASILEHPLINVVVDIDFFQHRKYLQKYCGKIVYTDPIDGYFEYRYGKLEYRQVHVTLQRHFNHPDSFLQAPIVVYSDTEDQTLRAVEYKSRTTQNKKKRKRPVNNHTIVVQERWLASVGGGSDDTPLYPVPEMQANRDVYEKYHRLAQEHGEHAVQFVGPLATYQYMSFEEEIQIALKLFYKQSPLRQDFMENEFQAYKRTIETSMKQFQNNGHYPANIKEGNNKECEIPLWAGEFGKELRVMVPWAYYQQQICGGVVITKGVPGTKYAYYFSSQHTITNMRRGAPELPDGNPFGGADVHMSVLPENMKWMPPPMADFFRRPEMESILNGKPLVVILGKYSTEWGGKPVNYMSIPTLRRALQYLTPKYTVLYKRHTSAALMDHQGLDGDLRDKDMIRNEFPDVLLFEDFAEGIDNVEDSNLLLFGLMSMSKRFLTTQGGNAVVGSYFGGTNIILIKKGKELKYGDYNYFHRFSNATVVETTSDRAFLREMEKRM